MSYSPQIRRVGEGGVRQRMWGARSSVTKSRTYDCTVPACRGSSDGGGRPTPEQTVECPEGEAKAMILEATERILEAKAMILEATERILEAKARILEATERILEAK
eukprot:697742-Prorocentrum_minimum.AAC.1